MNIHDFLKKIKSGLQAIINLIANRVFKPYIRPLFRITLIVTIGLFFGGLWQLTNLLRLKIPLSIGRTPQTDTEKARVQAEIEKVYSSKTGHSYYYSFCGALKRIKLENRVTFANAAAARAQGFVPAKNCKGVE